MTDFTKGGAMRRRVIRLTMLPPDPFFDFRETITSRRVRAFPPFARAEDVSRAAAEKRIEISVASA